MRLSVIGGIVGPANAGGVKRQEKILQEVMRRYGMTNRQVRPLDAFESFIYEFERESWSYISHRRSPRIKIQG